MQSEHFKVQHFKNATIATECNNWSREASNRLRPRSTVAFNIPSDEAYLVLEWRQNMELGSAAEAVVSTGRERCCHGHNN